MKSPQGGRPGGNRPPHDQRAQRGASLPPRANEPSRRAEQPAHSVRSSQAGQPRPDRGERPRLEHKPAEGREYAPATGGGTRGGLFLYGLHAVAAALGNPSRRLRRLLLTEEAEAALAAHRPPPWPLPHERTDRAKLDQMLGRDVVHQGAALLADPLAPPPLASVMERPGPLLVLDQVADPRNVGAILRSAAAFGVAAVITQERNAPDETGALAKAASGALESVPLLKAVNIARTLIALKAAGCWVVGLDAAGARPLDGPSLAQRRVALVVGAEGEGMRRLTRDTCDEVARLVMPGTMESLNVSAATAIALYELRRG